ncbi:malonate decarboxylase holo-ACP synthase [Caballeronia sp. LZ062]|uniref:malonate decarboxylase holo-ACP synthase n=1 Tax=unclassified Caballeronia TaxID=2646786 RepID=UPI00285DFE63|nr:MULTISPECIES: malonate decarboxylase holo-ACP synthase [unclassified Caballeronia]MDR5854829.1 malonate decarboxylase holo-ACP synthase [Caballeronia sp. LZ050]MDR5870642.1 malonate decarboxylase holo-ACP synthase [Caballeronia sp. LZ062]
MTFPPLEPRPHDLFALSPAAPPFADAPAWVEASLARAPFVVVRRAPRMGSAIAVGIRGAARSERFGTWVEARDIECVLTPEALRLREPAASRRDMPAFALLHAVAPIVDAAGLGWGPAGSTGFELASGQPTVTASSDLDVIVRAPEPLSRADASRLLDALSHEARRAGTRIDVQIETPEAAFSLAEFARQNVRVLLRHADGPRFAADPWAAP